MKHRLLKGQSPLVSHSIIVGFSLVLLIIIVISLGSIKSDYQQFVAKEEINQVCGLIRGGIEKIYNPSTYTSPTDSLMGSIRIDLPDRLADNVYRVSFGSSSYIETLTQPAVNKTCNIGFPVVYNGSTTGGETEISWVRQANGTDVITMRAI